MALEDYSYAPDATRARLAAGGPFRVIGGRGIIDAHGNVIARCHARQQMDASGSVQDSAEYYALHPVEADDNAHALALILNNPASYFAEYCTRRAQCADTPQSRDWWHRMAGNARKASTL